MKMSLLKILAADKKNLLTVKVLKGILDNILLSIDSNKNNFSLNDTYSFIGEELAKIKVAIFFTVYDDRRKLIAIRDYHTYAESAKVLKAIEAAKINEKKIPLSELSNYQKAFEKKKAYFSKDRIRKILKIKPELKNYLGSYIELNSIVAPLILKNSTLGALEFYSPYINKLHVAVINDFAEKFASIVSNSILFNEIKISEAKFRDLFENANEGFVIYNRELKKFIETNRQIKLITGYTGDELRQINYINIFAGEERKRLADLIDKYTKIGNEKMNSGEKIETIILTKKGEKKIINLIINPTVKEYEWFFIINDITAAKNSELALAESKKRYKELWDNAPVGYHILDKEGRIIQVNKTEADMLGYSKKEMEGQIFLKFIAPEEKLKAKTTFKNIILKKTDHKKYTRIFLKKDGSRIYMSVSINLDLDNLGKPAFVRATFEDITDIFLAKQKLQENEKKYRNLVDNANEGVIIINKKGFITFANKSFLRLSGYDQGEIAEINISQLVHPDDHDFVMERFKKVTTTGKYHKIISFKAIKKNGDIIITSNSINLIKDGSKVTGIQVIIRDTTDMINLQNKIEWSKNHYERVIDTIQDAICTIDREKRIISVNKAFADKINRPIHKLKGGLYRDYINHFDGKILKNSFCATCDKTCIVEQAFIDNEVKEEENEYLDKKGHRHFYRIRVFPSRNKDGVVYQCVITIRDVTDKILGQERIQHLSEFNKRILNYAPVSIMTLDKNGTINSINEYFKNFSGANKHLNRNINDIEFFIREDLCKKYEKLLEYGTSFKKENCRTKNLQGETKYLNIIAAPLRDKNGIIEGAISMAVDNTEVVISKQRLELLNKELEKKIVERTQQLDDSNKQLSRALDLKTIFIADASHELRTPLTIVQGNLDLAIKEFKNQRKKVPELFSLINKEVSHMGGILSDLAMMTNIDARAENLSYERVDVTEVLDATRESLKILAEKKGIKITVKHKYDGLYVMGDETKLEKLFINLVKNAIKYSHQNGWIKIKTERGENEARIYISDGGIGISSEDLPYIFERFYRSPQARAHGEIGSGLGLAICRWVVDCHRGNISVESKLGSGSTFIVHLPYDYKSQSNAIELGNFKSKQNNLF